MAHLDPELDPAFVRANLAEAGVHLLIEIGRQQRAGGRQERFLICELAPLLAKADEAVAREGGKAFWPLKETAHE